MLISENEEIIDISFGRALLPKDFLWAKENSGKRKVQIMTYPKNK
jgi:hypothetical protein